MSKGKKIEITEETPSINEFIETSDRADINKISMARSEMRPSNREERITSREVEQVTLPNGLTLVRSPRNTFKKNQLTLDVTAKPGYRRWWGRSDCPEELQYAYDLNFKPATDINGNLIPARAGGTSANGNAYQLYLFEILESIFNCLRTERINLFLPIFPESNELISVPGSKFFPPIRNLTSSKLLPESRARRATTSI